jgi:peptidoglycan hydrolase CwlO-like protein
MSLSLLISSLTTHHIQIANQVDESKTTIENLQRSVQDARDKQRIAQEEVKKLERDMEEFKNNKEGKIEELKVTISLSIVCCPYVQLID